MCQIAERGFGRPYARPTRRPIRHTGRVSVPIATGNRDTKGRRGGYERGRITRDTLIATAERLFAERGIDAVSLREIAAAAGSHNTGAAQYHFGNKDRLLEAIFGHRATMLNARRAELLAQAAATHGAAAWPVGALPEGRVGSAVEIAAEVTVRATIEVIVRPLAELVGHCHYISFLARLQADHVRDQYVRRAGTGTDSTFRQARSILRQALPALPEPVFRRRFHLAMRMAIAALADYECSLPAEPEPAVTSQVVSPAGGPMPVPDPDTAAVPSADDSDDPDDSDDLDDLVTDLIEAMSGMLTAPSSRKIPTTVGRSCK